MSVPSVRLQPQKHVRIQRGHPWIYSNEIVMDEATKKLPRGGIVSFETHDRKILGMGSFNPHTLIAGRIFTPNIVAAIDEAWIETRLQNALALRERLLDVPFYRLVHAEADGLPGLIIDRFDDILCIQRNTAGMDLLWPALKTVLTSLLHPKSIILRNDTFARKLEGLPTEIVIEGQEPPETIPVLENGLTYVADVRGGQKTGWYFDQRDNHALLATYAKDANSVLDLYTHAGGFALAAAKAGARNVVGVDSSELALELAKKAATTNKLDKPCSFVRADVFEELDRRIAAREKFDVVIADPPPFVKTRKDIASGARGYRKLAKKAAAVTRAQGFLFIASCSHNMDLQTFTESVAAGLNDAKRTSRILHTCFAAPDHPTHPYLTQSAYLKGLLFVLD
ncbi:MAG: class I SAM-dependent rRNA methyltransferase [Alphaproteobacteria bacterium]|nr:class I SAM-dependent rRNA methyltransferase [Alphaproteobacteria bacterium]